MSKNVPRETEEYSSRVKEVLGPVGEALMTAMVRKGWKYKEVADRSGLTPLTVSAIMRGQLENVSLGTLDKIAFALGMDLTIEAE